MKVWSEMELNIDESLQLNRIKHFESVEWNWMKQWNIDESIKVNLIKYEMKWNVDEKSQVKWNHILIKVWNEMELNIDGSVKWNRMKYWWKREVKWDEILMKIWSGMDLKYRWKCKVKARRRGTHLVGDPSGN